MRLAEDTFHRLSSITSYWTKMSKKERHKDGIMGEIRTSGLPMMPMLPVLLRFPFSNYQ